MRGVADEAGGDPLSQVANQSNSAAQPTVPLRSLERAPAPVHGLPRDIPYFSLSCPLDYRSKLID